MEEGLLSLKWNNHKSTFFTVLSLLREKHTYTDVTLACEGRLYPAHRFVLSTCSEYFAEIFSSTTGNNIVIVLKDVRRADLEYLLDYMYLGQVDVAQSELASLIKTAECLRIKGLAIPDDEPPKTLMPRRQGDHREREASPPSKRKRSQVEEDRGESASNSSNNSSRNGASQHVVGSSSSGSSSQRLPPPSSSSQSQSLSSAQSSQAPTLTTKTSSSSLSSRLAPPQPSGRHTPTSPQPPLTSPTGHSHPSTPAAVIKQEVTEPPDTPEISYLSESFEEPETKPNVGDQEMSMAGPSGLQGGSEVWDGDTDLSGFTGDNYSGEGCEDGTDSEAQGGMRRSKSNKDNKRSLLPDEDDGEAFLRQLEDKSDHIQRSSNKTLNSVTIAPKGSFVFHGGSSADSSADNTVPMRDLQRLQKMREWTTRSRGSVSVMSSPRSQDSLGPVQSRDSLGPVQVSSSPNNQVPVVTASRFSQAQMGIASQRSQAQMGIASQRSQAQMGIASQQSQASPSTVSHSNVTNPLVCSLCSYEALTVRELIVHRQRLHWKQLSQIQQLQNQHKWHSLGHNQRLEDHSRQNMATSGTSPEVNVHARKEQRKFKCPYCPLEVVGRSSIENHVVTHSVSDEPNRRYWCSFCTQKCLSAPGLSSHIKSHEYQGDC